MPPLLRRIGWLAILDAIFATLQDSPSRDRLRLLAYAGLRLGRKSGVPGGIRNPRFGLERAAQAAENRHFRPMDAERGCILRSPAGRDTRDPP